MLYANTFKGQRRAIRKQISNFKRDLTTFVEVYQLNRIIFRLQVITKQNNSVGQRLVDNVFFKSTITFSKMPWRVHAGGKL